MTLASSSLPNDVSQLPAVGSSSSPSYSEMEGVEGSTYRPSLFEENLLDAVRKGMLCDLHTHLLGMGNHEFWLGVIEHAIPNLVNEARRNLATIECYSGAGLSHSSAGIDQLSGALSYRNLRELNRSLSRGELMDLCSQRLRLELERGAKYSVELDVVCSIDNLKKSCPRHKDAHENDVIDWLGVPEGHDQEVLRAQLRKPHIIYNARKQMFDILSGITLSQLQEWMIKYCSVRVAITNCFVMRSPDGEEATEALKRTAFHACFTPEFYPRRYALKDSLYEQYPQVIEILLDHVCGLYKQNGCRYVEFSVGFNDIVKNICVFRHLYRGAKAAEVKHGVTVRYLAGFSRHLSAPLPGLIPFLRSDNSPSRKVDSAWCDDIAIALEEKSKSDPNAYHRDLLSLCEEPRLFVQHVEDLEHLRSIVFPLDPNDGTAQQNANTLMEVMVGFDYMSDERNHSLCPFGLPVFLSFVDDCRAKYNGCFGVRYHCGEFFPNYDSTDHLVHMAVSSRTINLVLDNKRIRGMDNPLRIGHGVAFQFFPDGAALDPLRGEIQKALNEMRRRHIPVEINLRSNEYLVSQANATSASIVRKFQTYMNMPIILCTDNDGIMEIHNNLGGHWFGSVAAEFVFAINRNVFQNPGDITQCVDSAWDACFEKVDFDEDNGKLVIEARSTIPSRPVSASANEGQTQPSSSGVGVTAAQAPPPLACSSSTSLRMAPVDADVFSDRDARSQSAESLSSTPFESSFSSSSHHHSSQVPRSIPSTSSSSGVGSNCHYRNFVTPPQVNQDVRESMKEAGMKILQLQRPSTMKAVADRLHKMSVVSDGAVLDEIEKGGHSGALALKNFGLLSESGDKLVRAARELAMGGVLSYELLANLEWWLLDYFEVVRAANKAHAKAYKVEAKYLRGWLSKNRQSCSDGFMDDNLEDLFVYESYQDDKLMLPFLAVKEVIEKSISVAHVNVNGEKGTAWFIRQGVMITAWHVLKTVLPKWPEENGAEMLSDHVSLKYRRSVVETSKEFSVIFNEHATRQMVELGLQTADTRRYEVRIKKGTKVEGSVKHDYCFFRIDSAAEMTVTTLSEASEGREERTTMAELPGIYQAVIQVDKNYEAQLLAADPRNRAPLMIAHYPGDRSLRLTIHGAQAVEGEESRRQRAWIMLHQGETDNGSSGAPVFNAQTGLVVAIHQRGTNKRLMDEGELENKATLMHVVGIPSGWI